MFEPIKDQDHRGVGGKVASEIVLLSGPLLKSVFLPFMCITVPQGLKRERTRAIEERDAENKKWQGEKRLIGEEMKNMKKEVKGAKFKEETAVRVMQEKEQLVNSLRAQLNMERWVCRI